MIFTLQFIFADADIIDLKTMLFNVLAVNLRSELKKNLVSEIVSDHG